MSAVGLGSRLRTPGEALSRPAPPENLSPWSVRQPRPVRSVVYRLHPTLQAQVDAHRARRRRPVTGPRILPEAGPEPGEGAR